MIKATFIASVAYAHTPINSEHFADKGNPVDYNHIGALGEAFHNAWKRCANRATEWLCDDLGVQKQDPSFDNGYYREYGITERVPRVYENFNKILGKGNYWPAPTLSEHEGNLKVTFNDNSRA